jgi:hypothetical protein
MAIIELSGPTEQLEDQTQAPVSNIIELTPPTQPELTAVEQSQREKTAQLGQKALGTGELALSLGTSALLEPVAGVAGLVQSINPFAEEGAGAQAVEDVRGLAFQPGEAGQQVGQDIAAVIPDAIKEAGSEAIRTFEEAGNETNERFGPIAATVLHTLPTLALEAIPGALALKKARNIPITIADDIAEQGVDDLKQAGIDSIKAGPAPEAKDYASIADDLKAQRVDNLAEQVLPDQEILDAAERLNVDLNPSHYSTNRAFIDVENSLKSRAGSTLNTVEERAILDTGRAADNLILELQGTSDKSLLDIDVKEEIDARITGLEVQAETAYNAVNEAIPRNAQVNPVASREYINRALEDLGGLPAEPDLDRSIINRLPEFQQDAVKDHATLASIQTNQRLRAGENPRSNRLLGTTEGLDFAIEAAPLPKNTQLFRKIEGADIPALSENLTGKTFTDKGYLSTSTSKEVTERFTDSFTGDEKTFVEPVDFKINAAKGQNALPLLGAEAEVLLPRGAALNVISDKVEGGVRTITANYGEPKPAAKVDIDSSLLTAAEKKLLRIQPDDSHLTYTAIDRIRKDIGAALGKKSGPFKDDDAGVLKQLYKVLSEDQQGVADAFGVGADYSGARKLVSTRKGLEDEAVKLFGRDLQSSIVPKLNQAATGLAKGDTSKFNQLMQSLPAGRRQEVAATMLNDIFASGSRKKGSISSGFTSAFSSLNRNAAAKKVLFDQFPQGAEKRFDDIGKVATGIFNSKALENNSRTARDILAALEDGGLIGRLYNTADRLTPGSVTKAGIVGVLNKVKTPAAESADQLLTSAAFKNAVEASAKGSLDQSQKITKTPAFKKWLTAQPPAIQAEVAAIGFIPFLTRPLEQPVEQQEEAIQ